MLDDSAWRRLAAAPDLAGTIAALRGTPYERTFAGAEPNAAAVERRLRHHMVRRQRIPLPFLRGGANKLLDWLSRRVELDNLVTIVRGVDAGLLAARIRADLIPLGDASELDPEALSGQPSLPRLRDQLEAAAGMRIYARALANAYDGYERQGSTFPLENALQLVYWRHLRWLVASLSGSDRAQAQDLVGLLLDGDNLVRVYRLRTFFRLPAEQVMAYTAQPLGQVTVSMLQQAASGASVVDVAREAWADALDLEPLAGLPARAAIVGLELLLQRHLHTRARQMLAGNMLEIGGLIAYHILIEDEVRDLVALLEANAGGAPPERARQELIRRAEAA